MVKAFPPTPRSTIEDNLPHVANPRFVNHPTPVAGVDLSPFTVAGCAVDEDGRIRCPSENLLTTMGCDMLVEPAQVVGSLQPSYPLAGCLTLAENVPPGADVDWVGGSYVYRPEGDYFYRTGGTVSIFVRYVAYKEEQFTLIETEKEFRTLFAPIETPEEAVGYVQVVTGLSAYYGLQSQSDYVYYISEIEDTHAETVADGYQVYLFFNDSFGCGLHHTYLVEFHLTTDGYVTQVSNKPVFRNQYYDGWCID